MPKITTKQVIKTVIFTTIGAAPGTVWTILAGSTQSVVITCLGAFIGFGLSLPGVSAARVASGTAGMIIAKNVPSSMQDKVWDTFLGEDESTPPSSSENHEEPTSPEGARKE